MECAAVIPCFNEAGAIAPVVRRLLPRVGAIWVVDDGSSDNTAEAARKAGARVIAHRPNRGKGWALRRGLEAASNAGFEWAVMLDGDGQHDPGALDDFLAAGRRGADLVIGNRMGQASEMTWARRWVNRWMSARLSTQLGMKCPDSQCGYRLMRLSAWKQLRLKRDRYEVESEMLAAFVKAGFRVEFVDIPCLPAERPSRIHPVADTVRWFRWWLSCRLT